MQIIWTQKKIESLIVIPNLFLMAIILGSFSQIIAGKTFYVCEPLPLIGLRYSKRSVEVWAQFWIVNSTPSAEIKIEKSVGIPL